MTPDTIDHAEALEVFAKRFRALAPDEIADLFSRYMKSGALDFSRRPDGGVNVLLTTKRVMQ